MSKETNALKLALEALEECRRDPRLKYEHPYYDKAITAIREALADSALDRMAENARELGLDYEPPCKTGSQCTSKCQQCEQPAQKQEPKRWAVFCSECRKEWSVSYPHPGKSICAECDAKAGAQQQEPVSVMTVLHLKDRTEIGYGPASAGYDLPTGEYKLYTTPPAQRTWVGLTDEEYSNLHDGLYQQGKSLGWVVDQIEAKLREKNA